MGGAETGKGRKVGRERRMGERGDGRGETGQGRGETGEGERERGNRQARRVGGCKVASTDHRAEGDPLSEFLRNGKGEGSLA